MIRRPSIRHLAKMRSQSLKKFDTNRDEEHSLHSESGRLSDSGVFSSDLRSGGELISRSSHVFRTPTSRRKSYYQTSNDKRKARREEYMKILTNDLIESVCELFMKEQNAYSIVEVIHAWDICAIEDEEGKIQTEGIMNAVDNFIESLPPRYALGIESPAEVIAHMRNLAAARLEPTKSIVHVSCADGAFEKNTLQLSFCPITDGMSNIQVVTVVCLHTIGLMELVMGMLVSGGSEILDCNFMLSSEKIMLLRSVVNVKGSLRLERLEESIDEFIKASRGLSNSFEAVEGIVSASIGIVDKDQVVIATIIPEEENEISREIPVEDGMCYDFEDIIDPPISLKEIVGEVGTDNKNQQTNDKGGRRKRLVKRRSSLDIGRTLEETEDKKVNDADDLRYTHHSLLDHGFFSKIILTGHFKSSAGVNTYRGQLQEDNYSQNPETFALKVGVSRHDCDVEILQSMSKEGSMAKNLEHPNICKLLDMIATPTFVCLSYEYCAKGSLNSLLLDRTTSYDFLDIAQDISKGMAYLHSKNIIHRDLKPDNVFITQDNKAKIADFGLSVTDTGGGEFTGETGTYRWMAPEIIRHEKYSINSDTYSFGVILWQLVTRSAKPFHDLQPVQTAFAVASGDRPEIPVYVPEFIARCIKACWDQDQLRRPSFAYVSIALAQFGSSAFEKGLDCSVHSSGCG